MAETQLPPNDYEAECAVIGQAFIDGTPEKAEQILDLIQPEDMYSGKNRTVLAVIAKLAKERKPIDIVMVGSLLKGAGKLEQVGGYAHLTETWRHVARMTDASIIAHATRVRELSHQRRLLKSMQLHCAQIYAGVEDHEQLMAGIERDVVEVITASSKTKRGFRTLKDSLIRLAQRMKRQAEGETAGIPTGIASFDRMTGGIHDGDLTVVAARPGMGKTSFVMNIVDNVASAVDSKGRQQAALVFSLEMPDEQLAARMVSSRSGVDVASMRSGRAGNRIREIIQASGDLSKLPVYIDDSGRPTVEEIRARSRAKAAELAREGKRLACIVIDYLQIMNFNERRGEREDSSIGRITATLKALAKELDCPIIVLSQLNRGPENRQDKRPTMGDLRGSGAIEQDADNIIFIYRDSYLTKEPSGPAELIICKQRNGQTGVVEVYWHGPTTTFRSVEPGESGDTHEDFYT